MPELITSPSNPKIKRLLALQQKSSARREAGLFVVEGRRELQHCIDAGFTVDTLFVCPSLFNALQGGQLPPETSGCAGPLPSDDGPLPLTMPRVARFPGAVATAAGQAKVFEVSEEVYAKMAMREGTEGVVAEVKTPERRLEDIVLPANPLVVVLERVEKPGNLGAVLRSADAAGADAVLVCDPLTDLWNPNLIRASIGAVFTVPCAACASEAAIAFLKARGIRILTAQLQDSSLYYDCDMTGGTALVMGTEATGLTPVWRSAADAHIRIPMLGALDSLNVSVSAAILLFEAVRQRQNG
ncbi:MAG: RNA methyltransferase [Bacteroidales bacterium]|jgi:TrmH family RNA methyltransferase|nr:RNA methyltransferase [Bacteroidales bacterium]